MVGYFFFDRLVVVGVDSPPNQISLPLSLGQNLTLEKVPIPFIEQFKTHEESKIRAMGFFMIPNYTCGFDFADVCFKYSGSGGLKEETIRAKDVFLQTLIALRLAKPILYNAASSICVEVENEPRCNLSLTPLHLQSFWSPEDDDFEVFGEDFKLAAQIRDKRSELKETANQGLLVALNIFAQFSLGFCSSYQMAYLGLFSALEALFEIKQSFSSKVPICIKELLTEKLFPPELQEWLKQEYDAGRNRMAHGVQEIALEGVRVRPENAIRIGRLNELLRLCLLGFLSLDETILKKLKTVPSCLEKEPKILKHVSDGFLRNQKLWCDCETQLSFPPQRNSSKQVSSILKK